MQKYSVNQHLIETILSWVKSGEIAIPEIQRPFVWNSSKVRDLMDSLYQGFPVGYIIAWRNPNVKLKDGSFSEGKKILIDGQQRITALTTAILGDYIVNKSYQRIKIKIAFHPLQERFEVQNPAIRRDKAWFADISQAFSGEKSLIKLVREYLALNEDADEDLVERGFDRLISIVKKPIGMIELASELDIETVTEIFIRINSKGVVLSQADFAMSKIAADTQYGGNALRKLIDYFCHLAKAPESYQSILENDTEFSQSPNMQKIAWLKNENDDLYTPSYSDLVRVAFTFRFSRGRLSDLVSLLSGRNFETRTYEQDIARAAFHTLQEGVDDFVNETNFKRFLMIVRSAGFVTPKLLRSQNAINFAYIIYLKLRALGVDHIKIETYVRRWLVLSILTGRYSGSPESTFDFDIKQIENKEFATYLQEVEEAELSDAFWRSAMPQNLTTSVRSSPYFNVFLAAQVKANNTGFLSSDITVRDLLMLRGDVHHLFPRSYLIKNGFNNRNQYNQIANYVYMEQSINIKLGDKAPKDYFALIIKEVTNGTQSTSGIKDQEALLANMQEHCIPAEIMQMDINHYQYFLQLRRKLMAKKIRDYYYSL